MNSKNDGAIDSEGVHHEDEFSRLMESDVDGLGFCGCGNNEEAAELILRYLEAVSLVSEDGPGGESFFYFDERAPKQKERASMSDDAYLLCAYIADSKGLTEHGGSVFGAWLTDKGEKFVVDLRKALDEQRNGK